MSAKTATVEGVRRHAFANGATSVDSGQVDKEIVAVVATWPGGAEVRVETEHGEVTFLGVWSETETRATTADAAAEWREAIERQRAKQ